MIHACCEVDFDTSTSDKVQAGRPLGNNKCEWKLGSEMQQTIRKLRTSSEAGTLGVRQVPARSSVCKQRPDSIRAAVGQGVFY